MFSVEKRNRWFYSQERYLVDVIKGRYRGFLPRLLKMALLVTSWFYGLVVWCRNKAFERGWVRQYVSPVPVVSIGNIATGGTGKTPATLLIAEQFYPSCCLAILSRGYRSPVEKMPTPLIISGNEGPIHPASFCGDEPYLLAKHLPKALVVVGRDRRKASTMAVASGAELILLDDGLQHRALARDFDVVVLDGNDPFGRGNLLPAGFLRERVSALSRASLIILNHVCTDDQYASLAKQVAGYSNAAVVSTVPEVHHIWDIKGREISSLKGCRVGMFCGIAHPEYFKRTLEDQGAVVAAEASMADHVACDIASLHRLATESLDKGATLLVCTEKDHVKLPETLSLPLPVAWVEMKLRVCHGEDKWQAFLKAIRRQMA